MDQRLFNEIWAAAREFDSLDILVAAAALQLLPQNLTQTIRLETLSQVIASNAHTAGAPAISTEALERLANQEPVASFAIVRYEDPPETHFVESFGWRNDAYLVFPGIADDSVFILRHIALALDVLPEFFSKPTFRQESVTAIAAVLRISNELALGARLARWTEAEILPDRKTFVPSTERLSELKEAVSFTTDEMAALLAPCGGLEAIGALVTEFGTASLSTDVRGGSLFARPIVRHEGGYVVALPGALLDAARHRVVAAAIAHGVQAELSLRYAKAGWATAKAALRRLDHELLVEGSEDPQGIVRARGAVFQHDTDKVTQVLLVADALYDHKPGSVFGDWRLDLQQPKIDALLYSGEKWLRSETPPPNGIMTLMLGHGAGYSYRVSGAAPGGGPYLPMRCAELELISYVDGGNSVALWKYALAREKAHTRMRIMAFSAVDEYELYRNHRRTYYLSDDAPPDALSVEPGMAFSLRAEIARKYDPHPVRNEKRTRITQVGRLRGEGVPIYVDVERLGKQLALLVEGLPVDVWILGPPREAGGSGTPYSLVAQIVDGIAYWLWQFTPFLTGLISALPGEPMPIVIRVDVSDDLMDRQTGDETLSPFAVTPDPATRGLAVVVNPTAVPLLSTADNRGERELMRSILVGCRPFWDGDVPALAADALQDVIDRYAPLGQKKHFFFLNVDVSPDLDGGGLPQYRDLQEADVEGLLDGVGEHLRTTEGVPIGPIEPRQRVRILNASVAYCYGLLEQRAALISRSQLLEELIARHESIIHENALRALTVPTRLACFSSVPEMVKTLREEVPRLARASIANRFLIEYVATLREGGEQPPSLAGYDELLAIAHHIANFGFTSDSVHLALADPGLAMLGSGRLGVENDRYSEALASYLAAFSSEVISRSTRDFESHWRQGRGTPRSVSDLDGPSTAEFGVPLREVVDLMIAAVNLARAQPDVVAKMARADLQSELAVALNWPPERISAVLEQLILMPREKFLFPSPPFTARDVYPWKFNRRLSYLRRPFVTVQGNDGTVVLWGARQVYAAALYLLTLCYSGRFPAVSGEMRAAMAGLNDQRGKEFNGQVASVLRGNPALIVETRVAKFGDVQLPKKLGDIDVLTIDQERRVVRVIECKDLALARTPDQLSNQLDSLMPRDDQDQGAATVRHRNRVDWVKEHVRIVLEAYGVDANGDWQVEGLFIVDEPVFAPHLRKIEIPVMALEEFRTS